MEQSEEYKFHVPPEPLVCFRCGHPAWIHAMFIDSSGGICLCTACGEETTLRYRTEVEKQEIHRKIDTEIQDLLHKKGMQIKCEFKFITNGRHST